MKNETKISGRPGTLRSSLWVVLVVLYLAGLSGCGSVEVLKNTLRAASSTMVLITDLSLRFEGGPQGRHLEKVEGRVLNACQSLFDSADYRFRGEDIPLDTKIEAMFTADGCQRVIDQAQPEIEEIQNNSADTHGDTP